MKIILNKKVEVEYADIIDFLKSVDNGSPSNDCQVIYKRKTGKVWAQLKRIRGKDNFNHSDNFGFVSMFDFTCGASYTTSTAKESFEKCFKTGREMYFFYSSQDMLDFIKDYK